MIRGISHITLACTELAPSLDFYQQVLGGILRARWKTGAYLELGNLWLCLAQGPVAPRTDYSHIALDCDKADFAQLSTRISQHTTLWQENISPGHSIYFLDPDGHRLELHCGSLQSRLSAYGRKNEITVFS